MDANRFDAIATALISGTSRRGTLGGLLGAALGALGLADADEAWSARSGRCRQTCGACEECEEGRCRKKKSGKRVCKPGKCRLRSGLEECPAGQVRNPLTCDCCQTNGQPCSPPGENLNCCSEFCSGAGDPGSPTFCVARPDGRACEFGAQCRSGVCGSDGRCAAA